MKVPRLLCRADAGPGVGAGHYRRSLVLADALASAGIGVELLVAGGAGLSGTPRVPLRHVPGPDRDLTEAMRSAAAMNADGLVVDSYAVTAEALAAASRAGRLAVLDDLADRALPGDALVLNAALSAAPQAYPGDGPRLLGPAFALVRSGLESDPGPVRAQLERVMIQIGGSDPHGIAPALVAAVRAALPAAYLDVVAGPFFPAAVLAQIADMAAADRLMAMYPDPPELVSLLRLADVAVIGGGQSTYEVAAAGVPALAIRVAANQTANIEALATAGALCWVGDAGDPALPARVTAELTALAGDPVRRESLRRTGRALIDGRGATRAAARMISWLEEAP